MNENDNKIFYSALFSKNYDEAEKCLNNFESLYPKDYNVYYLYGLLYKDTGKNEKAKENLVKSLALFPEFSPAAYLLGDVYYTEKNYDYAIIHLKSAVLNYKLLFDGFNLLGLCYRKKGDFKNAIDNFLWAHGTYVKDMITKFKKFPEPPEKRNFSFLKHGSNQWKLVIMVNLKSLAKEEGINDLKPPSQENINKCTDGSFNSMDLWIKHESDAEMNLNFFAYLYGKLIERNFYSIICFNIGQTLYDLHDLKEAKKWIEESINMTPANTTFEAPKKTLEMIHNEEKKTESSV